VLISFGAVIGKISPMQLIVMTILELLFHSFNFKVLMVHVMGLADLGGTYVDHMFGAYFGLSVAFILGKPKRDPQFGSVPDLFSLIGTLFLWIYWPSFVAGAAPADSVQQGRALTNTIISLSGSTVITFWFSSILSKTRRFRPVDIQNATLAGGVAIGCTANLNMGPFAALMIGLAAGIVSTAGYNIIQPFLEENIGLHDTCGIHNLHAMPSVIGGIASVIVAGYKSNFKITSDADFYVAGGGSLVDQWWRQWVAMILCMTAAIGLGLLTGLLLKIMVVDDKDAKHFQDDAWWEVAGDFNRTLYSEMALVLGDEGSAAEKAISDFSSHNGRRAQPIS
jgi:ammonium transporter Rh